VADPSEGKVTVALVDRSAPQNHPFDAQARRRNGFSRDDLLDNGELPSTRTGTVLPRHKRPSVGVRVSSLESYQLLLITIQDPADFPHLAL
jgi:hypothetical protein